MTTVYCDAPCPHSVRKSGRMVCDREEIEMDVSDTNYRGLISECCYFEEVEDEDD